MRYALTASVLVLVATMIGCNLHQFASDDSVVNKKLAVNLAVGQTMDDVIRTMGKGPENQEFNGDRATWHYLVDLGTEMQGGLNLTIDGGSRDGARMTVRLSETLNADGRSVKEPLYTTNTFEDVWTLRAGRQVVTQHEYMEFRWAELIDVPTPLALDDVSAWVIRFPLSNAQFRSC